MSGNNLVITAHMDDEILGCTSVLGKNDLLICLTRDLDRQQVFERVMSEICCSFKVLDFKPCKLDKIGVKRIYDEVFKVVNVAKDRLNLQNLYGHYSNDLHQDHKVASQVTDLIARHKFDFKSYSQFYTTKPFVEESGLVLKSCDFHAKCRFLNLYSKFGLSETDIKNCKAHSKFLKKIYNLDTECEAFLLKYNKGV